MSLPDVAPAYPTLETGFYDGTLPSWLTDGSSGGGSVTVADASTDGGRARLATGTTATGDQGNVATAMDWHPGAHPIIEMGVICEASHDDETLASVRLMLYNSGDNYIQLRLERNDVRTSASGSGFTTPIDHVDPKLGKTEYRLRWYTERQEIEVFQEGLSLGRIADPAKVPDPSVAYGAELWVQTQDTTADRTLDVFAFDIGYLDDAATR